MAFYKALRPSVVLPTVLLALAAPGAAREAREEARIGALIRAVEELPKAKFIRNGSEHDAKAAAAHLRMKLGQADERVKTAEDFVAGIGSQSSMSRQKYRIRFADGQVLDAEVFFRSKLVEIDRSPK